jgi:hypothetical protein
MVEIAESAQVLLKSHVVIEPNHDSNDAEHAVVSEATQRQLAIQVVNDALRVVEFISRHEKYRIKVCLNFFFIHFELFHFSILFHCFVLLCIVCSDSRGS